MLKLLKNNETGRFKNKTLSDLEGEHEAWYKDREFWWYVVNHTERSLSAEFIFKNASLVSLYEEEYMLVQIKKEVFKDKESKLCINVT